MADIGLSIGQVAQRTGLSVHALRLYERTISRLAQLVREGTGNEAQRLELLREHRRHITEQLARLHDCLDLVNGKVASYERHLADGASGDPWQQQPQPTASAER